MGIIEELDGDQLELESAITREVKERLPEWDREGRIKKVFSICSEEGKLKLPGLEKSVDLLRISSRELMDAGMSDKANRMLKRAHALEDVFDSLNGEPSSGIKVGQVVDMVISKMKMAYGDYIITMSPNKDSDVFTVDFCVGPHVSELNSVSAVGYEQCDCPECRPRPNTDKTLN